MLGGLATGVGGIHGKLVVKLVEGIYLHDVVAHDGSQRAEFLLVLAHLDAVGSLGLLDAVHQLRHLLAGGIELEVDGIVVGREGFVIALKGLDLLRKFLFLNIKLAYQGILLIEHVCQCGAQQQGHDNHDYHDRFGSSVLLALTLFAFYSLEWIFSFHNSECLSVICKSSYFSALLLQP